MNFISDLALILVIAGITGLIFKRLRQPLILGYILAGFLASPHMTFFPSVRDTSSIHTWADIGIIFLMFALGLEFSFKKLVKMGTGPIITAVSIILFMMTMGTLIGQTFGWSEMNSLFLGGMLAMSSTTIIYKSFSELGLLQQKFAGRVISVLILEDIFGILLMVVLPALAASNKFEGQELIMSFVKLFFFLILWFVVGIYIVPQIFRSFKKWLNAETLLVFSVGLCFLMVFLAEKAGYSSALGAFLIGSILAETIEAEAIEKVISSVKDLFGAIFFVSVGMLVDPAILLEHWAPIVVIVAAILIGQMIFGTIGYLLSGLPLKTAMQCGFSMAQIGEFSFILASLGITLGVTSDFLYPVVVAASIITTFLTPYMIKLSVPAYKRLEKLLPRKVTRRLSDRSTAGKEVPASGWRVMFTGQLVIVVTYLVLTFSAIGISFTVILPFLRSLLTHWGGNVVGGLLTFFGISVFLRPIVMKKIHAQQVKQWRLNGAKRSLLFFYLSIALRFFISTLATYYILNYLSPFKWYWHLLAAALLVALITTDRIFGFKNQFSKRVKYVSIRLERTFTHNLRQREWKAAARRPGYARTLDRHDLHLSQLVLPNNSAWGGLTLAQLNFGQTDGVMIAAIVRGGNRVNIPDGNTMLFPQDTIEVIGDDDSLEALAKRMQAEIVTGNKRVLNHRLDIKHITIGSKSPFCEKTIFESGIREDYNCMVVGFEDEEEESNAINIAVANRRIVKGDTIWLVGEEKDLKQIKLANAGSNPTAKQV